MMQAASVTVRLQVQFSADNQLQTPAAFPAGMWGQQTIMITLKVTAIGITVEAAYLLVAVLTARFASTPTLSILIL